MPATTILGIWPASYRSVGSSEMRRHTGTVVLHSEVLLIVALESWAKIFVVITENISVFDSDRVCPE